MKETVYARAVEIAAKVIQAAGICRYDTPERCRRVKTSKATCDECIKVWLLSKARKELKEEAELCKRSDGLI